MLMCHMYHVVHVYKILHTYDILYHICILRMHSTVCVHMYVRIVVHVHTVVHMMYTVCMCTLCTYTCIMHLLKSYYCNALQPAKLLIQWITHTGSSYVVDQARGIQLKEFLT